MIQIIFTLLVIVTLTCIVYLLIDIKGLLKQIRDVLNIKTK